MNRNRKILLGSVISLFCLFCTKFFYDKKRKCAVVIKNYLDEAVAFKLLTSEGEVYHRLMPESSYFYVLKKPRNRLVLQIPMLGKKPPHQRLLKREDEHYKLIYASFVLYDKTHKDLRVRREKG